MDSESMLKGTDPNKSLKERFKDGRKARKEAHKTMDQDGIDLKIAEEKEREAIDELMNTLQMF